MKLSDMLFANALMGEGGGGGGGGDFSTAEVTIDTVGSPDFTSYYATTYDDDGDAGIMVESFFSNVTARTVRMVLYKGTAYIPIEATASLSVVTTGDIEAEINGEDNYWDIYVHGDGTITIS